jgi:hypothetical protein
MRDGGRMIRSGVVLVALTVTMLSPAASAAPARSSVSYELVSRFTTYYTPSDP